MSLIVKNKVSEQVQNYLRGKIVQGEIAEGTRLVEVDIATELGVSRTPVREALWHLRSMDLVRPLEKGGFEVSNVRRELVDILDIRAALEAHAARKAASSINADQIAEMTDICQRMEKLPFDQYRPRAELNRLFHEALIRAAGNPRLSRLVGEYHDYFDAAQPLFDKALLKKTQREHREILSALKNRDPDGASEAVKKHILGAAQFIIGKAGKDPVNKAKPPRS